MATAKKAPAKKTSNKTASTSATPDAIKLLTADHREVKTLFQQYQGLVDHEAEDDEKQALAQQICQMLTVHAQIEEELFYPAAQESIKEAELVDEANVEHASAKDLIAQLESSDPSDKLFDAKVKVLGEYIDHHVKEEEGEMFPQARRAKMDLQALGEQLAQRKQALMEEMGIGEEDTAEAENSAS
ncbi:MAG: hemerythrin [Rhizobacter sp.]|nr:hemerythrin [Rhizobacter sp.]